MKLSRIGELSLLEIIRKRFNKKKSRLVTGIGDDAAVLKLFQGKTLMTTDMMVEGVHFNLSWMTPYQLGFKLVSVNVSDIYAMGGSPEFLLLNIAVHKNFNFNDLKKLFDGIEKALETYKISLVGGDISEADRMVLSATLTGRSTKVLFRKGAKAGDRIYSTGYLGDSACGLEIMKKINRRIEIEKGKRTKFPLKWDTVLPLIRKHLIPQPKRPVRHFKLATSMIDISDGLLIDLSRLCTESRVGATIYAENIPLSRELKDAARFLRRQPLAFALGGGEDYELLFTAPKNRNVKAFCIGEITKSGMRIVHKNGTTEKPTIRGYQHFAFQR
jgi:thiamine-monophosphate kinase